MPSPIIASQTPVSLSADLTLYGLPVPVVVAGIAVLGVLVSALVSWVTAKRAAKNALFSDRTKRQSELSLRISELMSDSEPESRRTARRRFAVAVVKVTQSGGNPGLGNLYFIPMNSRVTIGRDNDNDIILQDANNWLSRWHCGFIADQQKVVIDDYFSTNGTKINNIDVDQSKVLNTNDEIELGPFLLKFKYIKENTILSQ